VVAGRMWCRTDGCVDEHGSRETRTPPTPAELAERGDRSLAAILEQLAP
jgi:hypothetical protein